MSASTCSSDRFAKEATGAALAKNEASMEDLNDLRAAIISIERHVAAGHALCAPADWPQLLDRLGRVVAAAQGSEP